MKDERAMLPEKSTSPRGSLNRFLTQFGEEANPDEVLLSSLEQAARRLQELSKSDLFLTVLMRTQGRRIEAFKDALLCLSAQTSEGFEVIVLVHNPEERALEQIRSVVGNQAPSFRARIRIEEVRGGGRARPLNAGVELARGRYIAAFDDDDLLKGNWVEAFQNAETEEPMLLRSVAAVQHLLPERWVRGEEGFRNTTWPEAAYDSDFKVFNHLVVNYSPFMSVAFPRALFHGLGFRFDEELAVCEDWDMILRGSFVLGTLNIPQITSIYRRWDGVSTSYTDHAQAEWQASERRVIDKLDSRVQLVMPGGARELRSIFFPDDTLGSILRSKSWRMIMRVQNALNPARHLVKRARGTLPPPGNAKR